MLVADGIGIVVGVVLGRRIPERILKWVSAVVFIVFGLAGIYAVLPSKIGLAKTALVLLLLSGVAVLAGALLTRKRKPTENKIPQ